LTSYRIGENVCGRSMTWLLQSSRCSWIVFYLLSHKVIEQVQIVNSLRWEPRAFFADVP